METETGFNLRTAIAHWRAELSASPGFSEDELRELESHLRETIALELEKGVTTQSAFNKALDQIGTTQQLSSEHEIGNSESMWKERLFWACWAAVLLPSIVTFEQFLSLGVANLLSSYVAFGANTHYATTMLFHVVTLVGLFVVLRGVQIGEPPWLRRSMVSLVATRPRVLASAAVLIVLGDVFRLSFLLSPNDVMFGAANEHVGFTASFLTLDIVLVSLLTWLQPAAFFRLSRSLERDGNGGADDSQSNRGSYRALRWTTAACVMLHLWQLFHWDYSNTAMGMVAVCLLLSVGFVWNGENAQRGSGGKRKCGSCGAISRERFAVADIGWKTLTTVLTLFCLLLVGAPVFGDYVNTFQPMMLFGSLLLLAVVASLKPREANAQTRRTIRAISGDPHWTSRVHWMLVGGLFMYLCAFLNQFVNGAVAFLTDSETFRILLGVAIPIALIGALRMFSNRQTKKTGARGGSLSLGMIAKTGLALVLVIVVKLSAHWIDVIRYEFNSGLGDMLRNTSISLLWPVGLLGLYFWLRSESVRSNTAVTVHNPAAT